jgi:aspartyl-tRNA(Asn)/glutamyl-tRNA(Gln) amidotransferase subunit C
MEINDTLVEKLAMLSRLHFSEAEKEQIKADLGKMIGFIDKLNELDTAGVKPLLHISDNINILREDVVSKEIGRSEALLNSPVKDPLFFKVPKVIKK